MLGVIRDYNQYFRNSGCQVDTLDTFAEPKSTEFHGNIQEEETKPYSTHSMSSVSQTEGHPASVNDKLRTSCGGEEALQVAAL